MNGNILDAAGSVFATVVLTHYMRVNVIPDCPIFIQGSQPTQSISLVRNSGLQSASFNLPQGITATSVSWDYKPVGTSIGVPKLSANGTTINIDSINCSTLSGSYGVVVVGNCISAFYPITLTMSDPQPPSQITLTSQNPHSVGQIATVTYTGTPINTVMPIDSR